MESRQNGWVIIITVAVALLFISLLSLGIQGTSPTSYAALYTALPILSIVVLLFYQLVIEVNSKSINIRFGVGLIRKSWNMSTIEHATPVKNKVIHGWGIRFNRNTTIYNVSGLNAVELSFKNRRQKVRIGTHEPERLAAHINHIIKKREKS